jgi:hypothetical protein
MWHAELTRKELIELCLGGYDPRRIRAETTGIVSTTPYGATFHAYWREDPAKVPSLPTLVITPDKEAQDFLTALNASPQAPTPFTALCRVLTREEAQRQFDEPTGQVEETLLRAAVILCMAEAILHSDGKFNIKSVGPAACRRTLSFAWARACATGLPRKGFEHLITRWLETYALMGHNSSSLKTVATTAKSAVEVLALTSFDHQISGFNSESRFAIVQAILSGSDKTISRAWQRLASETSLTVSLEEIHAASREERGGYLQQALRVHAGSSPGSSATVACAFLATQVAPGSLEHLEILRSAGTPELVFWYAFLAGIQHPLAILSSYGGLGFRVLRDAKQVDEHMSPPTADIAYQELWVIAKAGLDALGRRLAHVGEIEVELVPLVSATFSFPSRTARSEATERPDRETQSRNRLDDERRARIYDALNAIAKLIEEEPPEELTLTSPQAPVRRSYRKKGA